MHTHDEQEVDLPEVRLDCVVRRLRLEGETAPQSERCDLGEQRLSVAEFDVHAEAVRAGLRERVQQPPRVVDHQVAIEEHLGVRTERGNDRRTDRQVGDVVAVHAVDVQQLDVTANARDVGCEVREVGGKDRRRDFHHVGAP